MLRKEIKLIKQYGNGCPQFSKYNIPRQVLLCIMFLIVE